MKSVWHPLSTVFLVDPPCLATESLARMLLRATGRLDLIYAGDRMWPALRHGAQVTVDPDDGQALMPGSAVLVSSAGCPDLLRVVEDGSTVLLGADADPGAVLKVDRREILGRARVDRVRPGRMAARARRIFLDLEEGWFARPDPARDGAGTVLDKYESQAPFYVRSGAREMAPELAAFLLPRIPPKSRVLVVGCGTGTECLALARAGMQVAGIDFSPKMIELAGEAARQRGVTVAYSVADVRGLALPPRSLDAVLFTYDVYSFIPERRERVATLRRIRSCLDACGVVFLSARLARSPFLRAMLGLQHVALNRHTAAEPGDSHTRWIDGTGALRRSFVHVFDEGDLLDEIHDAGFRSGDVSGGHVLLTPDPPAMIDDSRGPA